MIGFLTSALKTFFGELWAVVMLVIACILDWIGKITRISSQGVYAEQMPDTSAVSVVIPTWNGRDLLDTCLPPLKEALRDTDEVILVDNASTDGTREYVAEAYPWVRVVQMDNNEGFRGGCNAGLAASQNDIVIFLNNDMAVEKGFLQPLLAPFERSGRLFSVSAQIYFWDKGKQREETGLTRGVMHRGFLRPRHDVPTDENLRPVLYSGGGSAAFSREKLIVLGGFSSLYDPFYVEDLDLSYRAWQRGWCSLFEPKSVVYHKHRGTIGKHFARGYIDTIVQRNNILFSFQNFGIIFLARHVLSLPFLCLGKDLQSRTNVYSNALVKATIRFGKAVRGRFQVTRSRVLTDQQILDLSSNLSVFCKNYPEFHDMKPERMSVLFVCPYSPVPPAHGGAVRMYHLIKELSAMCDVHLLTMTESESEDNAVSEFSKNLKSARSFRRGAEFCRTISLYPRSMNEFYSLEFLSIIQKIIDDQGIDIVQFEYTQMAQYVPMIRHARTSITEHDLSSVGVARLLSRRQSLSKRMSTFISLAAMFRYEKKLLHKTDAVFSVTRAEGEMLKSLFKLSNVIDSVPSGADVRQIQRVQLHEKPTLLFIGSFRHTPNVEGYLYFHKNILPIIQKQTDVEVLVVGGSPPEGILHCQNDKVVVTGFVEDLKSVYQQASVVICPILSGAGVRIKLLECMAYGVPFVSTTVGAEGLNGEAGVHYLLADTAEEFARAVLSLLRDTQLCRRLSDAGRQLVEEQYAWDSLSVNLHQEYLNMVR